MLSDETKSLIYLNLIQGVGSKTVQLLVDIFGCAENVLKVSSEDIEKELRKIGEKAPPGLINMILHYPLEKEFELISKHKCQIITLYDEEYPSMLKNIATPPPVLYVKGNLKPEDIRSISIVGPREAHRYGQEVSYKLSYELAQHNVTVVSGLAKGIDSCVHHGALDASGRTIAVLGNGLSRIYPPENKELAEKIIQSGVLISEFPMDMESESRNFPQRNRIISGLTFGTVIVEAPIRSGSLITAEHAHKQGRKVFAVPGQILSEHSSGCHKLIKNGALLVDTVNDLLEVLPQHLLNTTPDIPVVNDPNGFESDQLSLFLLEPPSLPYEVEVERKVAKYFETNFSEFSIKLQPEIQIGNYSSRADLALIDEGEKLIAIAECKRSGHVGSGVEQLHSYLSASVDTYYGLFANSTKDKLWTFYKKTYNKKLRQHQFKMITRSEFEKGVLNVSNTV